MTSLSAIARLSCSVSKLLCLCAFVLAFGTSPAFAQQGSGSHPAPAPQPTEAPKQPPAFPSGENPWEQNQLIMNSGNKPALLALSSPVDCFLPPLNGLSRSTVGVADLQIPAKAQHEKEDACSALRNNKISDAESHLQKAVKQAPGYSSAWVVLGQLLEAQHKSDQASAACSHPLATDSNFMPSYLCLADISARAEQWNEVLTLSNRALVVDPMNNPLAYDYNAAANLHLHRLPEAEKSALKAVEIDKANIDPRVHFLLAQIYEAKGERDKEAAQLREYLKFVTAPKVTAMVNGYLSQLESQSQPKK